MNEEGMTVLIAAAGNGREALVQLLLEKGADINATDRNGDTALMTAAGHGQEAVV